MKSDALIRLASIQNRNDEQHQKRQSEQQAAELLRQQESETELRNSRLEFSQRWADAQNRGAR